MYLANKLYDWVIVDRVVSKLHFDESMEQAGYRKGWTNKGEETKSMKRYTERSPTNWTNNIEWH